MTLSRGLQLHPVLSQCWTHCPELELAFFLGHSMPVLPSAPDCSKCRTLSQPLRPKRRMESSGDHAASPHLSFLSLSNVLLGGLPFFRIQTAERLGKRAGTSVVPTVTDFQCPFCAVLCFLLSPCVSFLCVFISYLPVSLCLCLSPHFFVYLPCHPVSPWLCFCFCLSVCSCLFLLLCFFPWLCLFLFVSLYLHLSTFFSYLLLSLPGPLPSHRLCRHHLHSTKGPSHSPVLPGSHQLLCAGHLCLPRVSPTLCHYFDLSSLKRHGSEKAGAGGR